MGAPGCPELACCTASMERVRMVLIESWSSCSLVIGVPCGACRPNFYDTVAGGGGGNPAAQICCPPPAHIKTKDPRRQNSQTPVIVMTAFGTIETAVQAIKTGAADFLLKPFSLDHLMTVVQKALEMRALRDENLQLREELGRRYAFDNIVGRSAPCRKS